MWEKIGVIPAWQRAFRVKKAHSQLLNEIKAQTNYLLHVYIEVKIN